MNSEALAWELYCVDAGSIVVPPGAADSIAPRDPARSRVLREFQVVYTTDGEGWFEDDNSGRQTIHSGDILVLFPGIRHAYSPRRDTGWQQFWVGFSGEHAYRLFRQGILDPVKPIHHLGLNQEVIADYEEAIQLCRQQRPGFQIRLGALVLQLLAHIRSSEIAANTSHGDSDVVDAARTLMQLHVDNGVEIDQIAAELNIDYLHLLKIFRQYTGLAPYQYFLQLRIHRAKELLSNPDLTIKEIAAEMQFDNQYYFSRLFKKKTGFSPSVWRSTLIGSATVGSAALEGAALPQSAPT